MCIRRHQTFALAPVRVRERRFRAYKQRPGFRPSPLLYLAHLQTYASSEGDAGPL